MPFRASIVICAYTLDRWDDLLASIASAQAQPSATEVVVVTDHAEDLRARLLDAGTGVRVVANTGPPGISGARNTGIEAPTGDIVAYLDDDARAEPGWLDALLAPYADENVVVTGSRIEPAWDGGRPRWFAVELDWVVGCTYRGMPETRADVRNVIASGMSFRRWAVEAAGGFVVSVGRGRGLPVGGEETDLCIRIRRLVPGSRVVYEPRAFVWHRVRRERATLGYIVRRSWAEGITKVRVARLDGVVSGLATERTYVARTLPAGIAGAARDAVVQRDPVVLGRAVAIVASLAAAAGGYLGESARGLLRRKPLAAGPAPADDRALRILHVTARYPPYVGGIETHTREVARRLARRGHRVTVLTTDPVGDLPGREMDETVEVLRVPAWPPGRDWNLAPGLLGIVGRRRWDVVHVQGVHTLVPPLAALAATLGGRRFLLTFHSGGHSSGVRTRLRGVQWRLIAPLLRRADALVAVSRFEAERFSRALGVPGSRIELVPNGADLPAVAAPGSDDGQSAADGRRPRRDAPLVLSLGRLERYKGHHRVIAAMPALRSARPGTTLRVAGAGPYEPELRRLVADLELEDAVSIAAVEREALPGVLASASLVTLLSDYESQGIAVMEALAARRPVLVADTSALHELAEEGLVRAIPLDAGPEATAAAILEALDRPVAAAPRDLPTWDATTDALEAIYRRVVAR